MFNLGHSYLPPYFFVVINICSTKWLPISQTIPLLNKIYFFNNMEFILKDDCFFSQEWTSLIGLPSVGNVGQLTIDCLISTIRRDGHDVERIGCIESSLLLPFSGRDSMNEKICLCFPFEVYACVHYKIHFFIQRAQVVLGKQQQFYQQLGNLLTNDLASNAFLILTGASLGTVLEESLPLAKRKFYVPFYSSNIETELFLSKLVDSDEDDVWKKLEPIDVCFDDSFVMIDQQKIESSSDLEILQKQHHLLTSVFDFSADNNNSSGSGKKSNDVISSAGSARLLYGSMKCGKVAIMGKYVHDGDNRDDAIELAFIFITNILQSNKNDKILLQVPQSWETIGGTETGTV